LRRVLNERRSLGIWYRSCNQDMRGELLVLHRELVLAEGSSGGIQQGVENSE